MMTLARSRPGLCLLAVITHDHVARALALGILGVDLEQAQAEVAETWGDRMDTLREAVAAQYPPPEQA